MRRVNVVERVAQTATLYSFEIELANVDRGVYATLAFRIAQHPSEAPDSLVARVLAYCCEYTDGIQFSPGGLSDPDEPPLSVRDATGRLLVWIDIGVPDATRLHKASKAAPRVAIYTHKDPQRLVRELENERIHRKELLEIFAIDRELITAWTQHLDRRMNLDLSISDGQILVVLPDTTLTGSVERLTLPR
jgi:uncharacterized protein YaeQ